MQAMNSSPPLQSMIDDLVATRCQDPFALLGRHREGRTDQVRVFYPDALEVRLTVQNAKGERSEKTMRRIDERGIYATTIPRPAAMACGSCGRMAGRKPMILTVSAFCWESWISICFPRGVTITSTR